MQTFEIKNRYTGAVIYSGGGESLRDVVVAAVKGGADLRGANLRGAYLRGANLGGADLGGAYLSGAYLGGAYLCGAYLRGANLGGANLGGANLRSANLGGANLGCANLSGANLSGANLGGAYLCGAYLRGAYLGNQTLAGDRPILQIGPVGSRSDYLVAYMTAEGVYVQAGCFFGALDGFRAAVSKTHGDSAHGREYRAAIAMIEAHAAIWMPLED